MKQKIWQAFALACVMLLPGCSRIFDWGKKSVYQGTTLYDLTCVPKKYIRSVTINYQLRTLATFTALWLSDEVVEANLEICARRHGQSEQELERLIETEKANRYNMVSFYVLATYDTYLDQDCPPWGIFLEINCNKIEPCSIKKVELCLEYKAFFGRHLTSFRTPYLVTFHLTDEGGNQLGYLDEEGHMKLYFRSVNKQATLTWSLPSSLLYTCYETPACCDRRTCSQGCS